ncbi:pali-domain-containing protein [Punctularia strigosozonata HHB-11173 SS5]|uniref:pali-domain-containing protein n=1 Tax=Punctularia strigosozonata (strain HHB-11173) TaxID=741275 RepID=UPI0004416526|nr:pali-domain-containing protein [Punctularia strigosozonata HHB-11173 SS5]EIN09867.1 pali-domain-containing protein [Punctularia strigosozonata HHB-11173 SS5]
MHPAILPFIFTLAAFVLLLLVTISTPVVHAFYFVHADTGGGVRFGIWGWCIDHGTCLSDRLGYRWDTQIIHSLTFTLVFYPIATGFTFLALLSLLPVLLSKSLQMYPFPAFSLLSLLSFFWSLLAFIVMIVLWAVAKSRFHDDGIKTTWGPLPWMSLAATIVLLGITVSAGCGTLCGRRAPYVTYPSRAGYY